LFTIESAALYASVIASASRAGFVLVTVELVLLFFVVEFSGRIVVAAVGLILVFGTVVGWGNLYDRLNLPDPYAGRREVAAATVKMLEASPAHGYGLGTWTAVYPSFAQKDFGVFVNAAHNDWLQWGSDGGVPMLACMLALTAGGLMIVRKSPWALGVPIVFLHGLIDFPMQGRFLPAVVFLVFGIAARASVSQREELLKPRSAQEPPRQLAVVAAAR
jgi:O-antigen ligase